MDGQGALPRSMLSNTGIEFSRVIEPQFHWKTVPKRKSRAIRRARTSFFSKIKSKHVGNGLKQSENIIIKDSKTREISVSESEKIGVRILGHHFSDTIPSVPIKKRRFLFRSPSPPLRSSSLTDVSEHVPVSWVVSYQNGTAQNSKTRHDKLDIATAHARGEEKRSVSDDKCDLNDAEEELYEMADFSGISILAAAACNSAMDDVMTSKGSVSKGDTFRRDGSFGIPESYSVDTNKIVEEPLLDTADVTLLRTASLLYCEEEEHTKMTDSDLQEDSSSSLPDVPDKSTGNSVGTCPSLQDRFRWDLNTVMDAWESPCDGIIANSQPVASYADSHHGGMLDKQEPHDVKIVKGDSMSLEKVMDKKVDFHKSSVDDSVGVDLVECDMSCNSSVADLEDCLAREQQEACCAPVAMMENAEETNALHNQVTRSFMTEVESFPAQHATDLVSKYLPANSGASDEEEADTHSTGLGFAVEIKAGKKMHLNECSSTDQLILVSAPYSLLVKTSSETATGEKTFAGPEAVHHMHSDDCCLADAHIITTLQAKERVYLCTDQDCSKLHDPHIRPTTERVSGILVGGDLSKIDSDGEAHGDVRQTEHVNERFSINNQSTEAGKWACLSESFTLMSHGLSDHEEITSGFMSNDEHLNAEKSRFHGRRSMPTDLDRSSTKFDHHVHTRSKDLMVPSVMDECTLMSAPHGTQNTFSDILVKDGLENALKDNFDCNCYFDASKNEETVLMGIEHPKDNDSQYEDGQFRESFLHGWGMDVSDDVDIEHVDYGSDDKETDPFEVASNYPAVRSFEGQIEGLFEDGHCEEDHDELEDTISSHLPSFASVSDIGTAKGAEGAMMKASIHSGRKVMKKLETNTKDTTEAGALTRKVMQHEEFMSGGDKSRESCHFTSFRKKLSGWDQLPKGLRKPKDTVVDSRVDWSETNYDYIPSTGRGAGEPLKMAGSTLRRKLSSQIERPKSYDISHRKERAYFWGTRNCNHSNYLHHDSEMVAKLARSNGRNGSSVHMHRKRRGYNCPKSSSHSGPNCHDSPGYYSATHLGAKDDGAVSDAKTMSNGFIVAPDGIVVEATNLGSSSHVPRRSADSSFRSIPCTPRRRGLPTESDGKLSFDRPLDCGPTREMSPGRHIITCRGRSARYGPRMVSAGRHYRFMPNKNTGSSLPVRHPFSQRERSFSPQRRPVQVSKSHMRSRSQSRTRCPHIWASVQRTRSPNFRPEVRFDRIKSPGRSSSVEHRAGFSPSSRTCTSPRRASRWIGDRKVLTGHFWDQECISSRRGGTSARLLSQSQRFDPVDSPEMSKGKFCGPVCSSRFMSLGVDKGPQLDGIDGDSRHGERDEMLPSTMQFDILGDAKHLKYNTEDVFTPRKERSEGEGEFHWRGSPRSFKRRVSSEHRNCPPRVNVEIGHIRYGRDQKQNSSSKSFRMRGCDDDSLPQRRQP